MTFLENARQFVRERLAEVRHELAKLREPYVRRLVLKEQRPVDEYGISNPLVWWAHDRDRARALGVLPDDELHRERRLVLLGNAGAGKSRILQFAFQQAAERFLADEAAPLPLFGEWLKLLSSQTPIEEVLDRKSGGLFRRAQQEHSAGCALFLDALDEARPDAGRIVDVEHFFGTHAATLAHVSVTCRRVAYDPRWLVDEEFVTYGADRLDDAAYAQIVPNNADLRRFREQCYERGIEGLLETPFDGFYLAREFAAGRPLPPSRRVCVDQRLKELLRRKQKDVVRAPGHSVEHLRFLAIQVACLATFVNAEFSEQEIVDWLDESRSLGEHRHRPSPEAVSALVQQPLFVKQDGRCRFVHQLYQEHLTAEAVNGMPLRKQRQLLRAPADGPERVHVNLRGVAMALAERNDRYRDHLLEDEPLIAGLAEPAALPQAVRDTLAKKIIDRGIAQDLIPWAGVRPHGRSPQDALRKLRPQNVAALLAPYLSSDDPRARDWGVAVAETWDGALDLNPIMVKLALDTTQNVNVRNTALRVVAATRDIASVRLLHGLFDDDSDDIRATALEAYALLEAPSPADYFSKILRGRRDTTTHGPLEGEIYRYCLRLTPAALTEAFSVMPSVQEQMGDLWRRALQGLYRHAQEVGFYDVPVDLILKDWSQADYVSELGDATASRLLQANPALLRRVWDHAMQSLSTGSASFEVYKVSTRLANAAGDALLDLLPGSCGGLTEAQDGFLSHAIYRWLEDHRTADAVSLARSRAPAFSSRFYLMPQHVTPSSEQRLLERRAKLAEVVRANTNERTKLKNICRKLLSCGDGQDRAVVLDDLRQADSDLWRRCIFHILEGEDYFFVPGTVLTYLRDLGSDLYVHRCLERLERGDIRPLGDREMLSYLERFKPSGYEGALKEHYRREVVRSDEMDPRHHDAVTFLALLLLLEAGDAWAWSELEERISQGRVPLLDDDIVFPRSYSQKGDTSFFKSAAARASANAVRMLADWYALVRATPTTSRWPRSDSLQAFLLGIMEAVDRARTVGELARLRAAADYVDARWLSHVSEDVESRLSMSAWSAGDLLDFINRERVGAVHTERDLFEWTCDALDRLAEGFEKRAEAVAGFWNDQRPKQETDCQNVLWPLLRKELQSAGLVATTDDEIPIREGYCDLLIQRPMGEGPPFRVILELKVAHEGYGERELIDRLEEQLVEKYMLPTGARHGAFIVLWFKCDRYDYPAAWSDKAAFAAALEDRRRSVGERRPVTLASYMFDMTTRWRGQRKVRKDEREPRTPKTKAREGAARVAGNTRAASKTTRASQPREGGPTRRSRGS
ncbi:hypothetical protein WME94_47820 [Sorangium sp. So ce429]